jgi:HNH endonuclease
VEPSDPAFIEYLNRAFRYNPESGELTREVSTRAGFSGKIITRKNSDGYVIVSIDRRLFRSHRIIWAMQTGEWLPADVEIDHRNNNRADNSWKNLRKATKGQNGWNRPRARRDSRSGIKGVRFRVDRQKYLVVFKVGGRLRKFGQFPTIEEAAARAKQVECDLHGEFAPWAC